MNRKRRKNNNLKNVLLIFVSIILIPLIFSLIINFPVLFSGYHSLTKTMIYSLTGFVLFIIFYYLVGQPVRAYIIAHELSHVIFAFFTGIKVKDISFKKEKSYVKTKGSNVFISLGPYILPFYSIILIMIYKAIFIIFGYSKIITLIFYFFIGAGYSFHILSTFHFLRYDQPDMRRYGYFFSLTFVIVWIIIISAFLFSLMFSKVKLEAYFLEALNDTKLIFLMIIRYTKDFLSIRNIHLS